MTDVQGDSLASGYNLLRNLLGILHPCSDKVDHIPHTQLSQGI
jgi:hypothetical protein